MFFMKSKPVAQLGVANKKPAKILKTIIILNGKSLPITITKRKKSKNLTMRAFRGSVAVSIPVYASYKSALDFIPKHSNWILNAIARQGETVLLKNQPSITLLDTTFTVEYTNKPMRPKVKIANNHILIYAKNNDDQSATLEKFIKTYAKNFVELKLNHYLPLIDRTVNKIFIKDTKSRWGTCSIKGNVSISWRLVFAPKFVMEYIIAHESAHLVHFNHKKEFWDLVAKLDSNYQTAQTWLKENSDRLHNISI